MMKRLLKYWVNVAFLGIQATNKKVPEDWAVKIASLTNIGLALILCGALMKIILRVTGLNSEYYMPIVAIICLPALYLFVENRIGVHPTTVMKYKSIKKGEIKFHKSKLVFAGLATVFYPILCFALMIVMLKIF